MSGKSIETCYICSEHSPRSSCYNIQIGYSTIFYCTIAYNLNVSLIKRVCKYYCFVVLKKTLII